MKSCLPPIYSSYWSQSNISKPRNWSCQLDWPKNLFIASGQFPTSIDCHKMLFLLRVPLQPAPSLVITTQPAFMLAILECPCLLAQTLNLLITFPSARVKADFSIPASSPLLLWLIRGLSSTSQGLSHSSIVLFLHPAFISLSALLSSDFLPSKPSITIC